VVQPIIDRGWVLWGFALVHGCTRIRTWRRSQHLSTNPYRWLVGTLFILCLGLFLGLKSVIQPLIWLEKKSYF